MISWANKLAQANASIQHVQAVKLMVEYNLDIFAANIEKAISDGIPRHKEIEADPADDFEMTNGEYNDEEDNEQYVYRYDSEYEFDENEDWGFNHRAKQYVKDLLNNRAKDNKTTNKPQIDEDFKEMDENTYAVNYNHVQDQVRDLSDDINIDEKDENSSFKLLDILDSIEISKDDLLLWGQFSTKPQARSRMKTVIDYVETNPRCSKHIKQKLRLITNLIIAKGVEKSVEYVHILLLIASHGSVCNVMKEVAVGNAYSLMTNRMEDFVKSQSLEQQIKKVLKSFRVLLVEELYKAFGLYNNTHSIAGFHNVLAKDIGVTPYNDENISTPYASKCNDWKKNVDKRYFAMYYNQDRIINHILEQINEKKISYQKVVQFLQDNCPNNMEKMEFLQSAIDIDTGKINPKYLCWILEKLNVFVIKDSDWKPIEKCWEDIRA